MEAIESFNNPTSTLNRFHETSAKFQRYKILLRRRWWFLLLTAAIAICVQALRITGKATEFIALGKLVIGLQVNPSGQSNVVQQMMPQDFYGTQIEILEGGELRRRALERVRGEHPELKEIDVEIRVTQTKGSSILNVAGVGEEPKFTRIFLDSLLVEFIAFRREMIEKSVGTAMNKVIEEVLSREKAVKEKSDALNSFLKNNDLVVFEGDRNQAATYLRQLQGSLYLYQTELKLMEKMGLEDYLRSKERGGSGPSATALSGEAMPASVVKNSGSADGLKLEDASGGLARAEIDYLKALSDLRLSQSERLQMLRTYREAHEAIREIDEKITRQLSLIEIYKQQSMEEWQRRRDNLKLKIAALEDNVKEWEAKAREANDKIVMNQSLKSEFDRTNQDYQDWKRTLERLDSTNTLTSDMIAIMERPNVAVEDEPELALPLIVALFIGLAAGSVILLLFDRLDDRMNSFSEFQTLFPSESILGQIPEQSVRGDVTL
ncbi:MAG: hypothetical protein WCN98_09030, partial [Verrucomicrobiaceae bacterium]